MIIDAESGSAADLHPATPIGLPTLAKMAFDGVDLAPVWNTLVGRVLNCSCDPAALIDLSTIAHLQGRPNDRIHLQSMALELNRLYRQPTAGGADESIR